ncbi:MAG: hypothetical protein V1817_01795 [Candidatus Micrarchaeota archaeon]
MLGQLQAEGTKFNKIKPFESPRVVFTNVLVSEHASFVDSLFKLGVSKNEIKIRGFYNPKTVCEEDANDICEKMFAATQVTPSLVALKNAPKTKVFFQTCVERAVLAETLLNAMNILRREAACEPLVDARKTFTEHFLAKLLTGDGCLVVRKIRCSHGESFTCRGYVSDCNAEYRRDYREIMKKLGLSVASYDNNQRVFFSCSIENIRFLCRIRAFEGTRSWPKLLKAVFASKIIMRDYRRFKKVFPLSEVTLLDVEKIFGFTRNNAKAWVRTKISQGNLQPLSTNTLPRTYSLSSKAKKLLAFVDACDKELSSLEVFCGNGFKRASPIVDSETDASTVPLGRQTLCSQAVQLA